MILKEFTELECEYFRKACNFTQDELAVFNMRVKGCSVVETYMALSMSEATVNRRIRDIKRKIIRVL